ncbi:MAG: hypothetical protein GY723_18185 [bacterium]|nr:hypothetical protein [bacterium]MCP5069139.1 hypothetical protein [bacterium]
MARSPRWDAPGVAHHVMVRGIERRAIFYSDEDRIDFLGRLDRLIPELGFCCFGFALMSNHVHLVLRSGSVAISRLMARLNGGYARAFNLRHDRSGYLFQNRFKSRLIESDADLLGVVTYVCRNPLEAEVLGSVAELALWPWSSFSALAGDRLPWSFESTAETLGLIAEAPDKAREALRARVAQSDPGSTLLGGWTSMPGAQSSFPSTGDATDLDELIRVACRSQGIHPRELMDGSRVRAVSRARAIVAHLGTADLGLAGRQVAAALGTSPAAISQAAIRGRGLSTGLVRGGKGLSGEDPTSEF